jgi:capsular polysaccharide transport system ATP-binding protein
MVALQNVTKTFSVNGSKHTILDNVTVNFPERTSVALLGRNGAGKSSLLKIIAGTARPSSGKILRQGSVSWPVGFAGSFNGDLSGSQNVKFIARIYGVDTRILTEFVRDFADLGQHYHLPFRTYSAGMRSRLAFGVSMGVRFDTYLVDEVTSVGDAAFKERSEAMLTEPIVVSHSLPLLKRICDHAAVLENSRIVFFDTVDEGIARHEENMRTSRLH